MINGNSGEKSDGGLLQKAGKALTTGAAAAADSERDSYKEAMAAARAGVAKDPPKPDRYEVLSTSIPSFKKGGRMKKRGVAKLHAGERAKWRSSRGR